MQNNRLPLYRDPTSQQFDREDDSNAKDALLPGEEGENKLWESDIERHAAAVRGGRQSRDMMGRLREALSRWRCLFEAVLILVILGLLLNRPSRETAGFETVGDITGFAPLFSQKVTSFTPSTAYIPENISDFLTDAATKQAWLDLVPTGLGYLDIDRIPHSPDRQLHDLPTRLPEYAPRTVFTTSVTHQLHCLYAIIENYAVLKGGSGSPSSHHHSHRRSTSSHSPSSSSSSDNNEEAPTEEAVESFHVQHCFEYLRQGILCAADVALEGTQTTFPEGFEGSDGWDAKHVCKNWEEVYVYLEGNRANDDVWISER